MSLPDVSGVQDLSVVPGAMQDEKVRVLPDGSLIEFGQAPAGWLSKDGKPRKQDYRAYHFTAPGEKRKRMVSVSTLLDTIVPKSGLPPWSEARGIEGAREAFCRGLALPGDPPAYWIKAVRKNRLGADRARDDAADRGLNIHAILEEYSRTGSVPSIDSVPLPHRGYFRALASWLLERDPEPLVIEELVCDPVAGFAGRRDLVARVGGLRIGYDGKTSERCAIFSSAHLQCGLYERAAIACGDEPCDELRVVVFAADGEWREMPCEATRVHVTAALAYAELIRPIDALCASANRHEREARL